MRTRLDAVVHLRLAPDTLEEIKALAATLQEQRRDIVVNHAELIREAIDEYLQRNRGAE